MKRILIAAAAVAASLSSSADAAVMYTFTAISGGYNQTGSFSITLPDFFSDPSNGMFFPPNIPFANLSSCGVATAGFGNVAAQQLTCGDMSFAPHNTWASGTGAAYDIVGFGFYSPFVTSGSGQQGLSTFAYYFKDGAFSRVGHYESQLLGPEQAGTLDVVLLPAVPEPATWALTILGFGAIGVALRPARGGKRVPALA